jgi:Transposase DDE domain
MHSILFGVAMPRRSVTTKKHLDFTALRQCFSEHLEGFNDPRVQGRCAHSLHDTFMTAFACMFFQDPSLAHFQKRLEETENKSNLMTLFNVTSTPKDTQLRSVIDETDSECLRPVFKDYTERLRRGKHLEPFQILPGHYLCAIDGVHYHTSACIHCEKCLHKTHKNGTTSYHHATLQGAFIHPDKRQVIPTMPEAIANTDGEDKQDCEINAAKRYLSKLKADHPRMGIIIAGDGLFSKAPMIKHTVEQGYNFIFVAKPDDHRYMMEWLNTYKALPKLSVSDKTKRKHQYTYQNSIPLNGQPDAPLVNYLHYELSNEKEKVVYKNSWVTSIEITQQNVATLARAGRCRWKIENECFNTLKNQGYHLEHNFGHGKKHLSHNMYLLTLLAFFYHQIFELTDPAYQLCRQAMGSKRMLWETFRVLIRYFIFDTWNDVMLKLMSGRGGIPCLEKNEA